MAKQAVEELTISDELADRADAACALLRSLSHPIRLMILCMLVDESRTVSEICEALKDARQSVVSQHLARLRHEQLVNATRDGNHIRYSLKDETAKAIIGLLHQQFCSSQANA